MGLKQVRTRDEIIFEEAGITLANDTLFFVEQVTESGVVIYNDTDRYLIDFATFESGFVAVA